MIGPLPFLGSGFFMASRGSFGIPAEHEDSVALHPALRRKAPYGYGLNYDALAQ